MLFPLLRQIGSGLVVVVDVEVDVDEEVVVVVVVVDVVVVVVVDVDVEGDDSCPDTRQTKSPTIRSRRDILCVEARLILRSPQEKIHKGPDLIRLIGILSCFMALYGGH